ncbi:MAG TPA: hypothetical protein DCR25_07990 [Rhodobacter sp.]|nr:MAG: hypothetical protein ABR89_10175 [Rhodobacter sp. BACL10 MAG-120910-bin24]KRO90995.1 MAG: hypothetical protein ABR99_05835 [Rhodobacter sp. BACL10 MAG-121220-bin24]KRP25587.1 MAG: hypothetical protein ABR97_09650 [Rhodobacter sp. BACL10 MAG-120419-bin15]HAG26188.1 hypothetical protein [Rhodobacter sp.]HAQ47245.1 hypothetical protein [Rhodobacter sp.]
MLRKWLRALINNSVLWLSINQSAYSIAYQRRIKLLSAPFLALQKPMISSRFLRQLKARMR